MIALHQNPHHPSNTRRDRAASKGRDLSQPPLAPVSPAEQGAYAGHAGWYDSHPHLFHRLP